MRAAVENPENWNAAAEVNAAKESLATRENARLLRAFIERIERFEKEEEALKEDKSAVYGEAKMSGYDVKAIRQIVKLRKTPTNERKEFEAILELYKHALGME